MHLTNDTIGVVQQQIGALVMEVWLLRQQMADLEAAPPTPVLEPLPAQTPARDEITGRRRPADTA